MVQKHLQDLVLYKSRQDHSDTPRSTDKRPPSSPLLVYTYAMLAILSCIALAASALAVPLKSEDAGSHTNTTLAARSYGGRFTWFDVGQGACGGVNQPYEYVSYIAS